MGEARIVSKLRDLVAAKAAREGRRIGYRTIAKEAGISDSAAKNWIRGTATQYRSAQIVALCRWLGCDVGDLLQIEGERI